MDKHNELRAKVARGEESNGPQPKASNMKKLVSVVKLLPLPLTTISLEHLYCQVWNNELAVIAQRWADQCLFEHDTHREKADGIYVGQNLYVHGSSNQYSYDEVSMVSIMHLISSVLTLVDGQSNWRVWRRLVC